MTIPEPTPPRAWVDVDLTALVRNARTIANRSRARLLPMVKANGYGLGAVRVSRALEALDPWGFGVATVAEGAELRAAGHHAADRGVLVRCAGRASPSASAHDLRPVARATSPRWPAWIPNGRPFHLEIDTGHGARRTPLDRRAARSPRRRACSATPRGWEGRVHPLPFLGHRSRRRPQAQWERFEMVLSALPVASAAGACRQQRRGARLVPRFAGDLVRPGIFLYGGAAGGVAPEPVARLCARVVATRHLQAGDSVSYGATWVAPGAVTAATLGIGYADGVPRSLSQPWRHRAARTAMPDPRAGDDGHDDGRVGCRRSARSPRCSVGS